MAITEPIIQEHFDTVRVDTHSTTINLPDTILLGYYNRARSKIFKKIKQMKGKYFYTEWMADELKDSIEYTLPVYREIQVEDKTYIIPKCSEVIQVSLLNNEGKYTPIKRLALEPDFNIEQARENKTLKGFVIADNSIFIFPASPKSRENGIKVYGIYEPYKIKETSTEREIAIPVEIYEILIQEVKVLVYEYRSLWNERNIAIADVQRMWEEYSNDLHRINSILPQKAPSLNHYT